MIHKLQKELKIKIFYNYFLTVNRLHKKTGISRIRLWLFKKDRIELKISEFIKLEDISEAILDERINNPSRKPCAPTSVQ